MKKGEYKRTLSDGNKLSKRTGKWDAPFKLMPISQKFEYNEIIGIGQWNCKKPQRKDLFVCISKDGKLSYLYYDVMEQLIKFWEKAKKNENK